MPQNSALLALFLAPPPAGANGGRIEINQVVVDAAGGFPYVISQPGSYLLTSDLTVTADVTAILIDTGPGGGGAALDLNGFKVSGPHSCGGVCTQGSADGVASALFSAVGSAVFGGTVRGFSRDCVSLSGTSHVHDLFVSECGRIGISAQVGSVVKDNIVVSTGREGISLGRDAVYAHNTVRQADQGGSGALAIRGGTASGGNACDDRSCAPNGQRRYYLSQGQAFAEAGAELCSDGFKVADVRELMGPAALFYDAVRGQAFPGTTFGWARYDGGSSDCDGYTRNIGSATRLRMGSRGESVHFFTTADGNCAIISRPAWCIEE